MPKLSLPLVGGCDQSFSIHLRPSGKPVHLLSALLAASAQGRDGLRQKRSRADEGHLAFQDVPELRQFVQPGPAQKAANRRNPLLIRKKLAARIAGVPHRTKLDELERHAVLTRPPLADKYRAAPPDPAADALGRTTCRARESTSVEIAWVPG